MNEVEFKKELLGLYDVAFGMKEYTRYRTEESLIGLLQYLKDNILTYSKIKKMSDTPEHKVMLTQVMDIILDYATDIFVEEKQYQMAYTLLNGWNKKVFHLVGRVSSFNFLKLAYVRCKAIDDDVEINLKNNPRDKLKDTIKDNIRNLKSRILKNGKEYLNFVSENSALSEENVNFLNFLRMGLMDDDMDLSVMTSENIENVIEIIASRNYDGSPFFLAEEQLATEKKYGALLIYADDFIKKYDEPVLEVEFVERDGESLDEEVVIEVTDEELGAEIFSGMSFGMPEFNGDVVEEESVEESSERPKVILLGGSVIVPAEERGDELEVQKNNGENDSQEEVVEEERIGESAEGVLPGTDAAQVEPEKKETPKRRRKKTEQTEVSNESGETANPKRRRKKSETSRGKNDSPKGGNVVLEGQNIEDAEISIDDQYTEVLKRQSELNAQLESIEKDTPEYLDTILQLVEVIYTRMRVLDKKIAQKQIELEGVKSEALESLELRISKYKKMIEERSQGIELSGIQVSLEAKIEELVSRKKELELELENKKAQIEQERVALEQEKNATSGEFEERIQDSKRLVEDIEIGDK